MLKDAEFGWSVLLKLFDCNEIVMMEGSERVKLNTAWTTPTSL
jgi:hypothetical protein